MNTVSSVTTVQITLTYNRPSVKATRAASRTVVPSSPGSRPASYTAEPIVSWTRDAASAGRAAGRVPETSLRYTAVPTLPRIAMPIPRPSS
ncbi:hypothetical protein AB0P39_00245 [Streptomyces niveus]